ncbi:MAG: T9SS type A sorting domain-containing protein, partial [Candidatus Eiseniibacteriota bacterium]
AGINPTTRLATWTFSTIDPATGNPPTDPNVGFLPVNTLFGGGTGYVTYTAQPAAALTSGSTVKAQATIQFDINSPIPTVSASNRVDDRLPTSLVLNPVQPLGPTSARVSWNSVDDSTGAGLAGAALYMKTDGGVFSQIGNVPSTGNSLDVPVSSGHTYGFYSLASDNSGNVENAKSSADATLSTGGVTAVQPLMPRITMLHPNYPNPFHGSTTVWFDLATPEAVTLEVFDLQGRRVMSPLEAKHLEPGSYRIDLHSLPGGPGVYFYRLHAGAYEHARKLVMLQ